MAMPLDVVMDSIVDLFDLALDLGEHRKVFSVLVTIPFVESMQSPHQRSAYEGNSDRNGPVHLSHPTISHRFSLNTSRFRLSNLLLLAFLDCRTVKIFLTVSKT
jgi:hypothetical protein